MTTTNDADVKIHVDKIVVFIDCRSHVGFFRGHAIRIKRVR